MTTDGQKKVDIAVLDKIIAECGGDKSHLIAMLQKVQKVYRYVPEDAMIYIGTKIEDLSPATVFGVATFYAQFSLDPKGKYEIRCCDGTACHVRGSMSVLNAIKEKLDLQDGKFTTADGLFSLETVEDGPSSSFSSGLLLDECEVVLPGSSEGPTPVSGVPGFLTIVYVENLFDEKDNFPVVEL